MRNGMRLTISGGLMAVLFFSGLAAAQIKDVETAGGYGYKFDDDPLNAGGFTAADATIRVRQPYARTLLIRPRTSFVPSLFQSVEKL